MANTYLSRTTGTPTNQNKWTWSAWVKFSDDNPAGSRDSTLLSEYYNSGTYTTYERINISRLRYSTGVSGHGGFVTNRSFADTNAFYHIVIVNDWSNSTTADRIKLYVNGVRETSFASFTAPSSGSSRINGDSEALRIGAKNNTLFFNGIMSHIHFIDGTAYDASAFGETDSTTGEWKIKTSPSVTYGNNGFFILKDGNSVTDQSGNGNNFTVGGGTLTKTEDCPDNVFATANPLVGASSSVTYSNGNLTVAIASSKSTPSTLGAGTGKFYFETKLNNTTNTYIGICSDRNTGTDFGNYRPLTESALVNNSGTIYTAGGSSGAKGLTGLADNDIIGCAFDVDNGKVWWSRNGQWYSGDANPTSTINISDVVAGNNAYSFSSWTGQFILGAFGTSSNANNISINFGNGYFGTQQVSSAGTNASGNGIFEYDVPTGYTALSTKGLNL